MSATLHSSRRLKSLHNQRLYMRSLYTLKMGFKMGSKTQSLAELLVDNHPVVPVMRYGTLPCSWLETSRGVGWRIWNAFTKQGWM